MNLIAAVSSDWGIGKNNGLLFSIPEDMKFFRQSTLGGVIIIGRKTLESFPGGKPLKNRTNIVLTRDKSYSADGAVTVHSAEELSEVLKKLPTDNVWVCGGAEIYKLLYSKCDYAYITKVAAAADADKYLVNFDETSGWKKIYTSEAKADGDYRFTFNTYKNTESEGI